MPPILSILRILLAVMAGLTALGAIAVCAVARDQGVAEAEAARRHALIAALPADAAKRVFGQVVAPSPGPPRPIGRYDRGCIAGAAALPAEGPNWQVMRPSRNRAWGHPLLVALIERFAAHLPGINGWPGILVGDLGQPRGGPMVTGHASHQIGLDADIWFLPMPERRLSLAERENMPAPSIVAGDGNDVDRAAWNAGYGKLIEAMARSPELARMFVNPAIKRALCREAGADRGWLRRVRPWWGHDDHFHIRLSCPAGAAECESQVPPPPGDGCNELAWWFTEAGRHPKPHPPVPPLRLSQLPPDCATVAKAP